MKTRFAPIIVSFIVLSISCQKRAADTAWLDSVHEEGRSVFYLAIREEIGAHPKNSELTEMEITKIIEAETRYKKLYGLLINIFYQKDEPTFLKLIQEGRKKSKSRFQEMYLDLARFSARMFVESFFETNRSTQIIREMMPAYKELDAVDLVVRSIGYHSKLDIPVLPAETKKLSPEFDKQGALDGAKFREAYKITKGKGAKIAVLDTGIDESHPMFHHTNLGKHFSLVGRMGKPWATDAPIVDWGIHGTAISSIAARYAPEAQITMYKFGDGETQNDPPYQLLTQCIVAASIYRAVHDGNDIISISASGSALDIDYLRDACRFAYDNNRVVVCGNLYSRWYKMGNVLNFPSQYETVVSVTAAEPRDDGTYGYWDVCAPDGATFVSAPNDIFAATPTYMEEDDLYIPSISAAIPVVSAVFALTISVYPSLGTEGPGEYVDAIMNLVKENANPKAVGFEKFSPECGYGLIDAEKTVKSALEKNKKRN
ncbi:MAG: S8/S53 family peptidase [Candidatus Aminicenantes bacterium]|nr:MAG: S8/S53 family peptidase [Candidatus Aminicenantes bacterium]